MENTKIIEGLNDLLSKNYDSERGYKNAATKTDNLGLAAFFRTNASNRYSFGHEIKSMIRGLGGEPDKGTSVAGDLHNTWINFKSALSFDKEEAILEAIESGEEACVNDYQEFLSMSGIPNDIRRTISRQKAQVTNALAKVEQYEELLDD